MRRTMAFLVFLASLTLTVARPLLAQDQEAFECLHRLDSSCQTEARCIDAVVEGEPLDSFGAADFC